MPINVTQGDTVTLTVEFTSSTGDVVTPIPSSGAAVLTYSDVNGNSATANVDLTATNANVFTGTWASSVASLGLVSYTITCASLVSPPATTGSFRVVN